jgi:hypothetical protein
MDRDEAEMTAIRALGFLADDARRMARFMDLTGLSPETLVDEAAMGAWQAAVLDYLMSDESLLMVFCSHDGLAPERVAAARDLLAGPAGGETA